MGKKENVSIYCADWHNFISGWVKGCWFVLKNLDTLWPNDITLLIFHLFRLSSQHVVNRKQWSALLYISTYKYGFLIMLKNLWENKQYLIKEIKNKIDTRLILQAKSIEWLTKWELIFYIFNGNAHKLAENVKFYI